MKTPRRCKTKKTYRQSGDEHGFVLDSLETFPELKVVVVQRTGRWVVDYINEKDIEYIQDKSKGKTSD
jgi:hypothetical protein